MAKNNFILYKDFDTTLDLLNDEQAGKLFKALYKYVNGRNEPEFTDGMLIVSFNMLKTQLERDLIKYNNKVKISQENGKLGGRPKNKPKEPTGLKKTNSVKKKAKKGDSVSVSVSDSVNDSDKKVIKEMVFDECKKDYIFNLKEIKQLRLFDDIEVNDLFVMLLIQRTKLKNPAINSKMAITTIYNKLEKLGNSDCIFLLKDAIEGGWKTVYPKDNKQTIPTTRYTGVEMKFEE
jgi:hypothetical protein